MRVVVFDDVLFLRHADLDGLPHELLFFPHADDAVAVVREARPDLVLMDYAMDDHATGVEAIAALRAEWPRGQLRVVGISSDGRSNDRMREAGADDAMPKSRVRAYLAAQAKRR